MFKPEIRLVAFSGLIALPVKRALCAWPRQQMFGSAGFPDGAAPHPRLELDACCDPLSHPHQTALGIEPRNLERFHVKHLDVFR